MCNRMAVWAQWDEIGIWIDDVGGTDLGHRCDVMHFYQASRIRPISFPHVEVAGFATVAVNGERGGAVTPVPLVTIYLDTDLGSFRKAYQFRNFVRFSVLCL